MKIKKLLTFFAVAALMVSCTKGGETEKEPTPVPPPPPTPDKILAELPEDPQPTKFENFTRRVMILDHTGQNCGYCPDVIKVLEAINKNPKHKDKVVIAAAHNYGTDIMSCKLAEELGSELNPGGGAPNVNYDFRTDAAYSNPTRTVTAFMNCADKAIKNFPAKAGISATVKDEGDNIVIYAGVKIAEEGTYTIGAWILEDGIIAKQNGGGTNFVHNHIIREGVKGKEQKNKREYNIYGDPLDNGGDYKKVFAKGDQVGKVFTIKKPAKLKDISKTSVAIFVCTPDKEGSTKKYVNNIIKCPVGESVPFSYTE